MMTLKVRCVIPIHGGVAKAPRCQSLALSPFVSEEQGWSVKLVLLPASDRADSLVYGLETGPGLGPHSVPRAPALCAALHSTPYSSPVLCSPSKCFKVRAEPAVDSLTTDFP